MSVLVITPVYGSTEAASVALGYADARTTLLQCTDVDMLPSSLFFSDDLVRGRSRAAAYALDSHATHFLWWDSDVVPGDPVAIVRRMLASGHDVVGAPYPVKRIAARYPYRVSGEVDHGGSREGSDTSTVKLNIDSAQCVEVDDIAMGFMLTSRECIQKMVDTYAEQLWYSDVRPGHPTRELVAIFAMMFGEPTVVGAYRFRTLDSEDYSFCRRWRALGGKVNMYVGPGAPLTHVGAHAFAGHIKDIGRIT